jgi:hypothetical protein
MDLKPLFLLISTLVLAAGIFVGWQDAQKKKPGSGPVEKNPPPAVSGGDKASATASPGAENGETDPEPPAGPTAEEARKLAEIEGLLEAQDFEGASRAASDLVSGGSEEARARALWLEAKATVFAKLLPLKSRPPQVKKVLLDNEETLLVLDAVRDDGRWKLTLPSGSVRYRPEQEVLDVEEVDAVDSKHLLEEQWEKIAPAIARLEHPIDIYIRGVRKLYQSGLPERGYQLMEKLIRMPDGYHVPLALGGSEADDLLRQWKIAAAGAPSETKAGTRAGKETAAVEPPTTVTTPPGEKRVQPPPTATPTAEVPGELARAKELMKQAVAMYRASREKEGEDQKLGESYDKLKEAREILQQLPQTDDVRALYHRLIQLMGDIGKALPFY